MAFTHVKDLHSPEMIADELVFCIDIKPMITLAGFMRLTLMKSPYVKGGEITEDDRNRALEAVRNPDKLEGCKFDAALCGELAAISRVFDIIIRDPKAKSASQIESFGPEWLADFMTSVADAMPSMTPDVMLHKTSMVMLAHLAAASHRKNGGVTRRPIDMDDAYRQLEELNKEFDDNEA